MSEFLKERALEIMDQQDITQEDIQQRVDIISYGLQNSGLWFGTPFISEHGSGEPLIAHLMEYDEFQLSVMALLAIALHATAENTINTHARTLNSKRNRLTYTDEYGDLIEDRWEKELKKYYHEKIEDSVLNYVDSNADSFIEKFCMNKFDFTSKWSLVKEDIKNLAVSNIDIYLSLTSNQQPDGELGNELGRNDGVGYENHLINTINKDTKWKAEGTSTSGDQGADLIIQKSGFVAVVQVKNYSQKVGNKSVQEAYSAKKFYNADMAFVVSKIGFTNSAWELSESTGVKILTERDFIDFLT